MTVESYRIVRFYRDRAPTSQREILTRGLTLEEAQAHCNNPETSSRTCVSRAGKMLTNLYGPWFDGYEREQEVG